MGGSRVIKDKLILDACCGSRMFWFQKEQPNTLYVDQRIVKPTIVGKGVNARKFKVEPGRVMDFRKLDLPDETFRLVVFDPPHLFAGKTSYMGIKYGTLNKDNWQEDLKKGFAECFRVLKAEGVLIFKWNEWDVPIKDVLALTPVKPLFGNRSGKRSKTHWITFMKLPN